MQDDNSLKIDPIALAHSEKLQDIIKNEIAFGMTQKPQLWDYADDVDSIEFLLEI